MDWALWTLVQDISDIMYSYLRYSYLVYSNIIMYVCISHHGLDSTRSPGLLRVRRSTS
jgi:hypothetical protein